VVKRATTSMREKELYAVLELLMQRIAIQKRYILI
jgi:hypothetical protein